MTDFEFATDTPQTPRNQMLGTFGFMHPMITMGISSSKLDFWALGATLFVLRENKTLTGMDESKKQEIYSQLGLGYAKRNIKTTFPDGCYDPEEKIIKEIISMLTVNHSTDDAILTKVSAYTDHWRFNDNDVTALLIQFAKEKGY